MWNTSSVIKAPCPQTWVSWHLLTSLDISWHLLTLEFWSDQRCCQIKAESNVWRGSSTIPVGSQRRARFTRRQKSQERSIYDPYDLMVIVCYSDYSSAVAPDFVVSSGISLIFWFWCWWTVWSFLAPAVWHLESIFPAQVPSRFQHHGELVFALNHSVQPSWNPLFCVSKTFYCLTWALALYSPGNVAHNCTVQYITQY